MNTQTKLLLISLFGLFILTAGCAAPPATGPTDSPPVSPQAPTDTPGNGDDPGSAGELHLAKSDLPRQQDPQIDPAAQAELVGGNTAFALDLYQQLRATGENLFYSPHSISIALAMTYAGARADTERQMADTLQFNLPQETLHPAFNALDLELASRGQDLEEDARFTLNITNAIWGQQDHPFLGDFLDTLALHYGAGLRLVDFIGAPEPARLTINEWVEEQTEERIKDLIPEGAITTDTRLVLTNAIYFTASWLFPFDANLTTDGVFTTLEGQEISIPMMTSSRPMDLRYARGDTFQAVELPYEGREIAMLIIMPEAGAFEDFEDRLDRESLEDISAGLSMQSVQLTMPQFEFESQLSLTDILPEMGMTDAFLPRVADFSGMDGERRLYITDVIHKAFVSVDETGTEAAAATAVIVGVESLPAIDVEMRIDKPFLFLIQDLETGTILFLGRVLDPGS